MSEVKRYDIGECNFLGGFSKMLEDDAGEWVYAEDHDRIVASLQAQIERAVDATNAECNDWAREYELRMEVTAERDTLRAEVERLQRDLATSHADASYYASTTEEQRAEVKLLKQDADRINWLAAQASMIYAHKGEASYQIAELPDLIQSNREECCPDDLRRAIDAAREASR